MSQLTPLKTRVTHALEASGAGTILDSDGWDDIAARVTRVAGVDPRVVQRALNGDGQAMVELSNLLGVDLALLQMLLASAPEALVAAGQRLLGTKLGMGAELLEAGAAKLWSRPRRYTRSQECAALSCCAQRTLLGEQPFKACCYRRH